MASTEHLGGNKHKIYVELGTDDFGKRIRRTKTVTVTSPRDLKKQTLEFELKCLNTPIEDLNNLDFNDLIDRWWNLHIKENTSTSVQNNYIYYLPMLKSHFGKMKLKKIKRIHIDEYFVNERKLGRKSLSVKLNILKSIFGKGLEWQIIHTSPVIRYKLKNIPQPEKREIFNSRELKLFYELLDQENDRNRLMLLATSLGGLRRGEMLGIGEDVIDFKNNMVTIKRSLNWDRQKKTKYLGQTKSKKERIVVYPESFMKELKLYVFKQNELRWQFGDQWELVDDVDLLFRTSYGKIMHPQSFTNLWKRICSKMDIKDIDLHDLRHSAASYLISNGTDMKIVSEFLGHSKTETTMNIYVHTNEEDIVKPAQAFEKLL